MPPGQSYSYSVVLITRRQCNWTVLVQVCFVHVCFVQVTILKLVWGSWRADAPRCTHFPSDICSVIQEGEITVEKCTHRGASVRRERHTLSLGQNKHGHNNSALTVLICLSTFLLKNWTSLIWFYAILWFFPSHIKYFDIYLYIDTWHTHICTYIVQYFYKGGHGYSRICNRIVNC